MSKVTVVDSEFSVSRVANPIKDFVETALRIPKELYTYWEVKDLWPNKEAPRLALAHYSEHRFEPDNRAHAPLLKVRGPVVDLVTGRIVCDSFGYNASLSAHSKLSFETTPDAPDGVVSFDTYVNKYYNTLEAAPEEQAKKAEGTLSWPASDIKLSLGYEGTLIRTFKWEGFTFFSNHKKIDATSAFWGPREKFLQIWLRLGGPATEEFYGEEESSPFCYNFLIADDEIRLASTTRDNMILYLGVRRLWNDPHWDNVEPIDPSTISPAIVNQAPISVDIANKFLFPAQYAKKVDVSGSYPNELIVEYRPDRSTVLDIAYTGKDDSSLGGDFVIVYLKDAKGEISVYRIESENFQYRLGLTENNPNLYNQFVTSLGYFSRETPIERFQRTGFRRAPSTFTASMDTAAERFFSKLPAMGNAVRMSQKDRMEKWQLYFTDAVSPTFKQTVSGYLARYNKELEDFAKFLLGEYDNLNETELNAFGDKAKEAIVRIKKIIGHNKDRSEIIKQVVSVIQNDYGATQYQLINGMRIALERRRKGIHEYRIAKKAAAAQ